jgi:hypothetical protein
LRWRKLGLVYCPRGDRPWARAYAHLPTPYRLDDRRVRVYFAGLDEHQFGRVGFVDLDAGDPTRVTRIGDEPALDLGDLGAFDDCGVVPSCVTEVQGRPALYYIGFQRADRVPYMLFTGLAFGRPGLERWDRFARTPVLDRAPDEPYSRSAPCVLRQDGGYRMWYWSCRSWTANEGGPPHYNNVLMHARSADGVAWQPDPTPCLEPGLPDEYALGRPAVVCDGDRYRMWFSARSHSRAYSIGYAESADGVSWVRDDSRAGIERSEDGWDSEMICYPAVIDVTGRRLMLYNGNRHGATGFGIAELERD